MCAATPSISPQAPTPKGQPDTSCMVQWVRRFRGCGTQRYSDCGARCCLFLWVYLWGGASTCPHDHTAKLLGGGWLLTQLPYYNIHVSLWASLAPVKGRWEKPQTRSVSTCESRPRQCPGLAAAMQVFASSWKGDEKRNRKPKVRRNDALITPRSRSGSMIWIVNTRRWPDWTAFRKGKVRKAL